jgi:hypothetical protein
MTVGTVAIEVTTVNYYQAKYQNQKNVSDSLRIKSYLIDCSVI